MFSMKDTPDRHLQNNRMHEIKENIASTHLESPFEEELKEELK